MLVGGGSFWRFVVGVRFGVSFFIGDFLARGLPFVFFCCASVSDSSVTSAAGGVSTFGWRTRFLGDLLGLVDTVEVDGVEVDGFGR